jgi:hypothetical protein
MTTLLDMIGKAGYPASVAAILVAIFFYLRKQESVIRLEINTTLARMQHEKDNLEALIAKMAVDEQVREQYIDTLREKLRESEDDRHRLLRRAEAAEAGFNKTLGF